MVRSLARPGRAELQPAGDQRRVSAAPSRMAGAHIDCRKYRAHWRRCVRQRVRGVLDPPGTHCLPSRAVSATLEVIRALFDDSLHAQRVFLAEHAADLERAVDLVAGALGGGHKLLLFGNGGSAADAQHIAAEFVGRMTVHRRPLPAVALTTDTSALTAITNDYGFDEVFSRQVQALGLAGDVALALSTSGNSPNVLQAVSACRSRGMHVIGLTGGNGGALAGLVDVSLRVSASTLSPRIQETHILIGHVLCELVERRLCGEPA
jgi:D-sedoheptulose 7-phosphate isomerase